MSLSRARVARRYLSAHLDGNGAADMSAEGHFFDKPRAREMREFAESGALSNNAEVARRSVKENNTDITQRAEAKAVRESPPTPTEIVRDSPGSGEFSTLSRYLILTEQPTDPGVPNHREDIPKHPDMVKSRTP